MSCAGGGKDKSIGCGRIVLQVCSTGQATLTTCRFVKNYSMYVVRGKLEGIHSKVVGAPCAGQSITMITATGITGTQVQKCRLI